MGPRKRDASTSIYMRVQGHALVPSSSFDAERLAEYPNGAQVEVDVHLPQSPKQYRLLRRIVGIVAHNTDKYPSADALMFALKVALGHVDSVALIGGGTHLVPRSMTKLQGHELQEFFDRAVQVMCTDVIPGMDARALIKQGKVAVGDVGL